MREKRNRGPYLLIGVISGVAAITVAMLSPAGADSANPTQAEALAGLETARQYIESHPDTPLPTPTETATQPPETTLPATTPATVPPTTVPPAAVTISGTAWNSGVWSSHNASRATDWGTWRNGKPIGNVGAFTSQESWATMSSNWWVQSLPTGFDKARQDLSLGIPVWPKDGAVGTDAQWRAIGTQINAADPDAFVRLGWEMNLPSVWALTNSNFTTWTNQFTRAATLMKETAPGIRIVWNPNSGADQTSGCSNADPAQWCSRRAFQAVKSVVHSYGIDEYDWYPAATNDANWNTHLTKNGHLNESYAYAIANGKKFSVPEWGIACTSASSGCSGNGAGSGGDNPFYITKMIGWFADRAENISYESYFDEPAAYIRSNLRTYGSSAPLGPNAPAAYVAGIQAND